MVLNFYIHDNELLQNHTESLYYRDVIEGSKVNQKRVKQVTIWDSLMHDGGPSDNLKMRQFLICLKVEKYFQIEKKSRKIEEYYKN